MSTENAVCRAVSNCSGKLGAELLNMGAGVTDAQYLMVTQHIFGRRKKGNRYVVKDVVYMRLVVCWGLTEIYNRLGEMSHLSRQQTSEEPKECRDGHNQ